MSKNTFLKLQHTEGYITQAAANIYAAYISSGRVTVGDESEWMKRSIREAIQIAKTTDALIVTEDEVG